MKMIEKFMPFDDKDVSVYCFLMLTFGLSMGLLIATLFAITQIGLDNGSMLGLLITDILFMALMIILIKIQTDRILWKYNKIIDDLEKKASDDNNVIDESDKKEVDTDAN